ncbi:hypothetical protein D9756_010665 [Leucocoprinus leucothites]|uniref:Uncharacterized protein n=1 Tax=Leucocoprinus leucothites TaxID=201217 RepID=A0A8H5FSK8_9AGAR|nr:hypothetical protein D9756_010665 [Leucoagaricus leucothites]
MFPPRLPSSPSSDSDSDAPEALTLSLSKQTVQKENAEISKAKALVREKTKLKNRQKDQKLKERAAKNKKGKGTDDDVDVVRRQATDDVETRMLRAMQDAEGEASGDDEDEDFTEFEEGSSFDDVDMDEDDVGVESDESEHTDDEEMGSHGEQDSEVDSEYDDEDMDSNTKPASTPESLLPKKPSNYLPDEIFKAAFSQTQPLQSHSKKPQKEQKRKRTSSAPKDVIIGSKVIRTLASTTRPMSSRSAVPSAKINNFLDRSLALKGQKSARGKGWERRPANIGILRRNGPAAHFVRNR